MKNNLFIVSKDGWKYIAYALLISFIFALLDLELFSFLSFLTALYFAYSFRNPERELGFLDEKAVVSPVDGVVIAIDELQEEAYTYKIIIESSLFNVGILRIPLTSKIQNINISISMSSTNWVSKPMPNFSHFTLISENITHFSIFG